MQTLEEQFNTRVNAFLDSTGMTFPPTDPSEWARGTLGRGRGRGVDRRAAGRVPGRSRRAASSGIRCGSRGRQSPMSIPQPTAVPERANDTGVRCALRRFRSAHRNRRAIAGAATSCAGVACPARAARAAQAVTLATPQSEGLVRVRGRVCLRTPTPAPLGSLAYQRSVPEGCRAPFLGGGGPVGRPAGRRAGRRAGRHRRPRPGRACSGAPFAFPQGLLVRSDPGRQWGEGVNTRSPLCRTKPSGRGVAPVTAIAARSAADDRATWPQELGSAADSGLPPCESPGSRNVNRPPASFSHRVAA